MKRINLLRASALVLLTVMACNKKNTTPFPADRQSNANKGIEESTILQRKEKVEEKMYNLTPEQIRSLISSFTTGTDLHQSNARSFMPESNLLPDSSVWVLEAALNYHFDRDPKDHEVSVDSVEFSAPLTLMNGAVWVSPSDLKNVYNQFKSSIAQLAAGPKKIKIIDITATIENGQINYKGSVVLYIGTAVPNCSPFPVGTLGKFSSGLYSGYGCSGSSAPDGPAMVTKKLNNCYRFPLSCGNSYYWVNVSTHLFYKAACSGPTTQPSHFLPYSATNLCGSGLLFFHSTTPSGYACSTFSESTLNAQITACNAVAVSNVPSTPAGLKVSNQTVSAWTESFTNSSTDWGWCNVVTYGYPVCNPVNPN
jgi:hypothetical protein